MKRRSVTFTDNPPEVISDYDGTNGDYKSYVGLSAIDGLWFMNRHQKYDKDNHDQQQSILLQQQQQHQYSYSVPDLSKQQHYFSTRSVDTATGAIASSVREIGEKNVYRNHKTYSNPLYLSIPNLPSNMQSEPILTEEEIKFDKGFIKEQDRNCLRGIKFRHHHNQQFHHYTSMLEYILTKRRSFALTNEAVSKDKTIAIIRNADYVNSNANNIYEKDDVKNCKRIIYQKLKNITVGINESTISSDNNKATSSSNHGNNIDVKRNDDDDYDDNNDSSKCIDDFGNDENTCDNVTSSDNDDNDDHNHVENNSTLIEKKKPQQFLRNFRYSSDIKKFPIGTTSATANSSRNCSRRNGCYYSLFSKHLYDNHCLQYSDNMTAAVNSTTKKKTIGCFGNMKDIRSRNQEERYHQWICSKSKQPTVDEMAKHIAECLEQFNTGLDKVLQARQLLETSQDLPGDDRETMLRLLNQAMRTSRKRLECTDDRYDPDGRHSESPNSLPGQRQCVPTQQHGCTTGAASSIMDPTEFFQQHGQQLLALLQQNMAKQN